MDHKCIFLVAGLFLLPVIIATCANPIVQSIASPDGRIRLDFAPDREGRPVYQVRYEGQLVIDESRMGFILQDQPPLVSHFELVRADTTTHQEVWRPVWGEYAEILSHCIELTVYLAETREPFRKLNLTFRLFNDGLGFRYEFPDQDGMDELIILSEETQFNLTGDHLCWWTPADYDSYEHLYTKSRLSEIDNQKYLENGLAASSIPEMHAVNTPVTMKTAEALYLSIHEANLTNYPGMTLKVEPGTVMLTANLVPAPGGYKARIPVPFRTPWRTIQISRRATDLLESMLIVNLNEPNILEDTDWIKPTKYMGIWWGMHIDKYTWAQGSNHGATTENAFQYIDFAAAHNIPALLIEGWNTGWENWRGDDREGVFDFITPYDDFDLEAVAAYAREKGVDIIGHHETSAAVTTYEQRVDSAFALYKNLGIDCVKTGYVGAIIPKGEYHHGQWMVNHYRRIVEKAARFGIMLDVHEPIKPTGLRRTYPNMMTREGVRGTEFNAWSSGNPPAHTTILPFTRLLAGPIDYTPGIFDIKFDRYRKDNRVHTTLAHQLATYVVIYSPLQMAADLPENYEGHPAFQFIMDVPTDWQDTRALNGEIGEYVTIARKEKGRENWFLGSLTDQTARVLDVPLDFLRPGQTYQATIYADAEDAHWDRNPTAFTIQEKLVDGTMTMTLHLAEGGGQAISFKPVSAEF